MSNAQNGARIKAWAGAGVGAGSVKNIVFKNFTVSKVDNPVVIDQVRVLLYLPSLYNAFESNSAT
jgi:polygalacturonase